MSRMISATTEHRIDGGRVVITGATSGIGRAAALELAGRGAHVVIVCRNRAKGERMVGEIEQATPGASVAVVEADLADLASVRTAAQELRNRFDSIDVLVNNAGIHAVAPSITSDGFDHMLASNYLGPFLLTNLVLDRVTAAPAARVIIVASEAHRIAGRLDPEHFEDLGDFARFRSFRAYGRTKLLDILFAEELARRLTGTGAVANSLDPGTVATNLYGQMGVRGAVARIPLVRTPEQGARMTVRLASDPALAGISGRYFTSVPGLGLLPPARARRNADVKRRIWERTAALVELAT
jgi:retinol dehydrogenase-12